MALNDFGFEYDGTIMLPSGEVVDPDDFFEHMETGTCDLCGERYIDCFCANPKALSSRECCEPDECPDCGEFLPRCTCGYAEDGDDA